MSKTVQLITPKPIIRCGDALHIESNIEGQIIRGPYAYSLADIVRFLGDDATLITHRCGNEFIDMTEELANTWIDMQSGLNPEDDVPAYVAFSMAWDDFKSDYSTAHYNDLRYGTYRHQHVVRAGEVL
jgi:hypothetical protein